MAAIPASVKRSIEEFILLVRGEIRVDAVYLYGSHAKGTAREWSDIDLAVISPDFSQDLFEERIRLMKLALRVDDRLEPCPFHPEEFNLNHPLVSEIQRSGIQLA